MTLQEKIKEIKTKYQVVSEIDLDHWHELEYHQRSAWLRDQLAAAYKTEYGDHERIIMTLTKGDIYTDGNAVGDIVTNLRYYLQQIDITNFFVVMITNQGQREITDMLDFFQSGSDTTMITVETFNDPVRVPNSRSPAARYQYNSADPIKIDRADLSAKEEFLLTESKTFCIYPWIHIHAYPTGHAYPCCHAEQADSFGNAREQTLEQLWNSDGMKTMRLNMLTEQHSAACNRCYEQEKAGFFSGRRSANKHHGHHVKRIHGTLEDGAYNDFKLTYWDIRFSNLCNLRCRSCGHIFSSQWYQDQAKIAGDDWASKHSVLNYAGRTETDIWEQLVPHLDYVEQIYFAGGEPLMMEEHYNILEELERRGRFDVRLIYNTNFTHVKLKDRLVFDYWKKFKSVAVGASLDAMGPHAEYIRKGTQWETVESNRAKMLEICPEVDFYISPTLSIMNAWHLTDFHRDWVDKGFLRPQDLNVNVLQDPYYYRIDIAPQEYKLRLKHKFEQHLEWLRPRDQLQRATVGFEAAINFMMDLDNTHHINKFWEKTNQLDAIRNENILEIIPELSALT